MPQPVTVPFSGPPLDLNRLLEVLAKQCRLRGRRRIGRGIPGGVAFDRGCRLRGASRTRQFEKLASALSELHARLRVARMSDEEAKALPVKVDGVMLEMTGNSTWTTDAGPFDVLAELKDSEGRSVPYEELVTRAMIVPGDGFSVHVASINDIIAAKTFANRDKDREALPELLDIQERERSERPE